MQHQAISTGSRTSEKTLAFYSGDHRLVGTLHLPAALPAPFVIGCHGLLANRQSPKQIALARACCEKGIAYFRFDHQGCGESEGDFASGSTLERRCQDLRRAVEILNKSPELLSSMLGLFGSSFGGTVALAHAFHNPPRCLVTYAAPVTHAGLGDTQIREHLPAGIESALAQTWHFDIRPLLDVQRNILIVHAEADPIVPAIHAREIYQRARDPKQLVIQNGGDHPMSDPLLQARFLSQALDWYQRALNGWESNPA